MQYLRVCYFMSTNAYFWFHTNCICLIPYTYCDKSFRYLLSFEYTHLRLIVLTWQHIPYPNIFQGQNQLLQSVALFLKGILKTSWYAVANLSQSKYMTKWNNCISEVFLCLVYLYCKTRRPVPRPKTAIRLQIPFRSKLGIIKLKSHNFIVIGQQN